ncbi:MAG TPA: class I SAM-dependent methyltransferase [Candidatus Binataceae bacterium]|nr:class I SAM-dependent methyltransferase [Candidatus Binataceae bacterium]
MSASPPRIDDDRFFEPGPTVPTRQGYDRWAEVYDHDHNPLLLIEAPEVVRMLGEVRGLTIGDVAVGTGRHALRMAASGAKVVAFDFSSGMLAQARAKSGAERIRFVIADCSRPLPVRAGAFDRVVCALLADHIQSLEFLFAELKRVCRREGFIVLTTVHPTLHLVGVRARFRDPVSQEKIYPASYEHRIADFVMAATRAGLRFDEISEHKFTPEMAAELPQAAHYAGWPLLLAMKLSRA